MSHFIHSCPIPTNPFCTEVLDFNWSTMKTINFTIWSRLSQPPSLKTKSEVKSQEQVLKSPLLPVFKDWTMPELWFLVGWTFSATSWLTRLSLEMSKPSRTWFHGLSEKMVRLESLPLRILVKGPKEKRLSSTSEKSFIMKLKLKNLTKEVNHGSHTSPVTFKSNSSCSIHGLEFHWHLPIRRLENTKPNST